MDNLLATTASERLWLDRDLKTFYEISISDNVKDEKNRQRLQIPIPYQSF